MVGNSSKAVIVLWVVGIITAMAAVLFAIGRTPFCECGVISLWSGNVASNQNSQQFADPYTFTHIIHGALFYFILWLVARKWSLGARGIIAVGAESLWEIVENTPIIIERYRTATLSLDYYGDSIFNSVGDVLIMALAFWLVSRLPVWLTVASVIGIEVLLAIWIRDGLLLNIIMLIYPIDAVKTWQTGGG